MDALVQTHTTRWSWTKGHAEHEDNNRCDWLAQNAARTQTSSWPDGSPHGTLALNLGADYLPPHPQTSLFEAEFNEEENDPG